MQLGNINADNYVQTRRFSDQTLQSVINIIQKETNDIIDVSSFEEDVKKGIDLNAFFAFKSIAVRIRQSIYLRYYGEITIRKEVVYGGETEASKWHKGIMADWCFYGFEENGEIVKWVLIDQKLLFQKLGWTFQNCDIKRNPDGTEFYVVPWHFFPEVVIKRSKDNNSYKN